MLSQVRVMLCDEAGKPLPPSECRKLRAWMYTWFVATRPLMLVEPTVRMLPSDTTAVAARKADAIKALFPGFEVAGGQLQSCVDKFRWDLVGECELVLEGGLQQVCVFWVCH
jgi:hypothetical protein